MMKPSLKALDITQLKRYTKSSAIAERQRPHDGGCYNSFFPTADILQPLSKLASTQAILKINAP